jgi:hypothetical protein
VVSLPGIAANTKNGEGAAVKTDLTSNGAKNNAEETKEGGDSGAVR